MDYMMKLTETYDVKKAYFLKNMTLEQFDKFRNKPSKSKKELENKFRKVQYFCNIIISHNGIIDLYYEYSKDTHKDLGGRLYSSNGIQGISKVVRGFLASHTTDIDMKNAHPVILNYICKKHDIPCAELEYYIKNRESILSKFDNRELVKKEYLKMVNTNKSLSKEFKDEKMKLFDKEMGRIQKRLLEIEEYKPIRDLIPIEKKMMNEEGSLINRILCMYENKILQHAIQTIKEIDYGDAENRTDIEIFALMFDGFMINMECNQEENINLINLLNEETEKEFSGLNMEWDIKPHDKRIPMPIDYEIPTIDDSVPTIDVNNNQTSKINLAIRNDDETKKFSYMVKEFEKNHCKIINHGIFIKKDKDDNILMSKSHLLTAYEHLYYESPSFHKITGEFTGYSKKSFIKKWISPEHEIKCYDDIGIYPNNDLCPSNIYNMWIPFEMELKTDTYEKNEEGLQFMLNHIRIMCNNEEECYEFFVKWIGQMIQFPEIKTIMPLLIGQQGSGKGSLIQLFYKMFGKCKVFETTDPNRDVWGNFNSQMKSSFLVNLDELSKKDLFESIGKVKGLVTNEALTINEKMVSTYKISSYHRFIATTNSSDPIPTSKDDRRNWIIRCSDEKIGDSNYFIQMNKYLDDENVIRTCYDYFKSIQGLKNYNFGINIPETEYHSNLKESNKSPIDCWLESFVLDNYEENEIELLGNQTYQYFNDWKIKTGVKYETTCLKLGVTLINMKIKGIYKGKHTKKGKTKIFKIQELKDYYKLNNLVDAVNKNVDEDDCDIEN